MTPLKVAGFQWDRANRTKCEKHGVSAAAIEDIFQRAVTVFPDPAHSNDEERFKAIGRTNDGRSVLLVFTVRTHRDVTYIRPISARYMHKKEVAHFEKETARAQKR